MHEPSPRQSIRQLPSLDGLRAISIGLVLGYHVMVSQTVSWGFGFFNGTLGVRIFFCISGFIITYLLLTEAEAAGISLKSFYLRRAVRILPVYYTYLAVLFVLTLTSALQVSGCQFLTALTFTKNYACNAPLVDSHLWSLAVEFQFYLFWPFVVAYCRPVTAVRIALVLCAASPISRTAEYLIGHRAFFWLPSHTDALMMGAMLAYISIYRPVVLVKLLPRHSVLLRLVSIALMLLPIYLSSKLMLAKLTVTIGPTLQAICATYLMASLVFYRKGISYHFLNIPVISYIGVLSYSLYIWQQLFLLGFPANSTWAFTFPINILLIFATSAASYHLLEYPLLALRRRLHQPISQADRPIIVTSSIT